MAKKDSSLFLKSLIQKGNGKLLDFDNPETGIRYRYAQFNTLAVKDCPFRSAGCEAVCYATKGNHVFPSVIKSRENSHNDSKRDDFGRAIAYTIRYACDLKRYKGNVMIVRIHESGDFYSVQYLRKWINAWQELKDDMRVVFVFYTKSFPFFLMLTEEEKEIIRSMMKSGQLAMNLSVDDTTTAEQMVNYLQMIAEFPLANTYRVTENTAEGDDVCDCENCAKCGACNKAQGGHKVVRIHSASTNDIKKYRKNRRERA